MVQEGLCATQDDFVSQGTKMSKERNVRINNGLKTKEMLRQKASNQTFLTERGLKIKV